MKHIISLKNFVIPLCLSLLLSAAGCSKTDLSTLGNNITAYASVYSKGVYKSDNGGISWYPLLTDQEDIYLYSKKLFLSPDNKRIYVTTTGGGLFFADLDRGILNRVDEFKDEDVRSVAFRRATNGEGTGFEIFVAKKETGIYKSVAGTDNWEPCNKGLTYRDVNVLYTNAENLFAGTINGIFRWDDASKMWQDISEGIKNKNIFAINNDPEGKAIYAGAGAYQDKKGRFEWGVSSLYKSSDNGKTWEAADNGLPDDVLVFSIAINPVKHERIYLGTSEGVYRSTDSGNKWSKTDNGLTDEFKALDIRITRLADGKDLVYAAGVNGLFMTLDEKNPEWAPRSYGYDNIYISSILLQVY
jgi:photosystem II stability/assembly factor-like uncharacterized protein